MARAVHPGVHDFRCQMGIGQIGLTGPLPDILAGSADEFPMNPGDAVGRIFARGIHVVEEMARDHVAALLAGRFTQYILLCKGLQIRRDTLLVR